MRAIFLDIDGIIATLSGIEENFEAGRDFCDFVYDRVAMDYLGALVRRTGALVVLSSSWRHEMHMKDDESRRIVANLLTQLAASGVAIDDETPLLTWGDRSTEIAAWLEAHPCDTYVIIDDRARLEDRPDVVEGHLVLVEDSEGLRHAHYLQALRILLRG